MPRNPHYQGTEEWHAWESGHCDTLQLMEDYPERFAAECNEDHLMMIAQAYAAGVRAARTGQSEE
jgi:hypothetical protein